MKKMLPESELARDERFVRRLGRRQRDAKHRELRIGERT